MSLGTLQWPRRLAVALLLVGGPALAQSSDEPIKNIRGVVRTLRGDPITDAIVFVRDTTTSITRTLRTNSSGLYRINGLPANGNYEVHAEFEGSASRTRVVSSFLNRTDNVINLEIEVVSLSADSADDATARSFQTFDLVEIHGSFEVPDGVPAPIPSALLLHGYGETRAVWQDLKAVLLERGWAVLAIDLRGHGQSRTRNRDTITAEEAWRRDPQQFPLDLEPALAFLKTQPRLNAGRIAIIGFDVGANLALSVSGRLPEVGTVVAMSPDIDEAMSLAGAGQDFNPHTVLLMVNGAEAGARARESIRGASRVTLVEAAGGTASWLAASNTIDEILRWLRDSY